MYNVLRKIFHWISSFAFEEISEELLTSFVSGSLYVPFGFELDLVRVEELVSMIGRLQVNNFGLFSMIFIALFFDKFLV